MLFISDLHLSEERPQITAAFLAFLSEKTGQHDQLYILGDFFDAWIGDDDDRLLAQDIARALDAAADRGVKIFFQHGNRDFLLGDNFASRCGMELLPDFFVLTVNSQRWLLAHGDQFCTEDSAYQQFRATVRDASWQREFLHKPIAERRDIAGQLRAKSKEANSMKAEDIMDVVPQEIENALLLHGCDILIHGHTHRPARHAVSLPDGRRAERVVLGEWKDGFWYAMADNGVLKLVHQA
ncbi:MAG TPA: UDP-2,3-diacylglucosamine diphosphatase [Pseudomonadales bacterium]|nr:UDP-2,3-diacylglucosamine diphosphatase [Pseudomonadales bacterium]